MRYFASLTMWMWWFGRFCVWLRSGRFRLAKAAGLVVVSGLALLVAPAEAGGSGTGEAAATQPSRPFLWFDAMHLKNKPDLSRLGFRPLRMLYGQRFWAKGASKEQPHIDAVRAVARSASRRGELVCVDIEHWPLRADDDGVNQASLAKYMKVAHWMHEAEPGLRLGFYGIMPIRSYWAIASGSEKRRARWRRQNEKLMPLAGAVDVIFPSLYTFYSDRKGWVRYARAHLKAARQYNRPVYAFLWPRYHQGGDPDLAGEPVPGDFWRLQLETCYRYADGVVIWSGQGQWDPEAAWWQETKRFMESPTRLDDKFLPASAKED